MKKLIIIFLLSFHYVAHSQNNNGYVVEYNLPITVEFEVYDTPLRINKVESQSQIDYSSIKGLLQSYLSANNINWAKSEYINKEEKITRDNEHFVAVKKSTINDYIQLESAYIFTYQNRQLAFVKYSFVFEKLPFPWTSLMILENKDNRWYISKLINQNQILLLLGNLSNSFLIDCFTGKSKDAEITKIISDTVINNKISIGRLGLQINKFDDRLKKKFYDSRITDDKADFRNGTINSEMKRYDVNILHPFLIEQFTIADYDKSEQNLTKNEITVNKYQKSPEAILLNPEVPIDLISKISINDNIKKYTLIKYRKGGEIQSIIIEEVNSNYQIAHGTPFDNFAQIITRYKTSFIKNLFDNVKDDYKGSDGGTNIDELFFYINKNEVVLAKYLDK